MSPEAEEQLALAHYGMKRVEWEATGPFPELAAREAYLAALHAACAYIAQHVGRVPKSHSGVQAQFHDLCRQRGEIAPVHPRFLSEAYAYKAAADYLGKRHPDFADLPGIIASARALIAAVEAALTPAP